jgi:dolichol-phosphate mannosyltransferase
MFNYFTADLKSSTKISLISPVYKSEKTLVKLVTESSIALSKCSDDFEIILVNDDIPNSSWNEITRIAKIHKSVKAICLDKNHGQHLAILEGLKISSGDLIVVIDCDLQEPPSAIPDLIKKMGNLDYILAERANRKAPFLVKLFSFLFYRVLRIIKGVSINSTTANFGVFSRATIDSVITNKKIFKYFPLAIAQTNMKSTSMKVLHSDRFEGKSTYSFKTRLKLALYIMGNKKPIANVLTKASVNV